ncbi:hypothetical protein MKQ70_18605 [Chitinophaga sedimenti]|uniref:hypothetical protein n=1 Tax=Chitinophaga sedimenti TaxID=2033606 RepID=UPI0020069AD3|nr:hypothetical protein [Chitinophaga sedimenti]MCK7556915.1 hypothetical protein [Chitinophaga sedimenti]
MKKSYLILLLLLAGGTLQAQSSKQTRKEEKEQRKLKRISIFKEIEEGENTFNREFSMGGRINTDGWSGFTELAYKNPAPIPITSSLNLPRKSIPSKTVPPI